jgi:hypothetical protein
MVFEIEGEVIAGLYPDFSPTTSLTAKDSSLEITPSTPRERTGDRPIETEYPPLIRKISPVITATQS